MAATKKEAIEAKAEEILLPILEKCRVKLYDVEFVKEAGSYYLRAYIDKEGGVTIDDCEAVSRLYSPALDDAGVIREAYVLEVSSPGLGRHLRRKRDYENNVGKRLEIHTYRAIDKKKEFFGLLKSWDEDTVTILEDDGTERTFQKADLSVIRLAFDF
ncbi:MAG: ribosome maturation factor RimP [Bilifractor sp.]